MEQTWFTRWRSYLLLEFRKGMSLIPFFVVSVAATCLTVLAAAVLFSAAMDRQGILPKISVAIVTLDDAGEDASPSLKTRLAVGTVTQMNSVKTLADFRHVSRDEAGQGLADGSLDAAIYIAPDTYDDINNGVNTPVTIRLGRDAASLSGSLFTSLVGAGVRMIRTVEAAVYTPYELAGTYPLNGAPEAVGDQIFDVYLHLALGRHTLWQEESVSAFGDLSIAQFYLLSGFVLILMLFGIGFTSFYTASERQVLVLLRRSGIPGALPGIARVLAISGILLLFELILTAAWILYAGETGLPAGLVRCLLPELCMAFLVASLINLPGQWIVRGQSALVYLLAVIALFMLSGGLLPTAWLPPVLKDAAAFSPVHICQSLAGCALLPSAGNLSDGLRQACLPAVLEGLLLLLLAYPGGVRHET